MKYTESHEWISLEGRVGIVGITRHAQGELGDVVYVELPKIGQHLQMGDVACVLESTKAAVDIYAPVSGKVISVNESLRNNPSLVNTAAEKEGWLFQVELSNLAEWEQLTNPLRK
jgi:glycine cleavage system H protein